MIANLLIVLEAFAKIGITFGGAIALIVATVWLYDRVTGDGMDE